MGFSFGKHLKKLGRAKRLSHQLEHRNAEYKSRRDGPGQFCGCRFKLDKGACCINANGEPGK
jgi:hypothetical protein